MASESRQWFALALLVGLGWLVHLLAPVITPFAISAGLAYLGDPLVDRLERLRIGSWTFGRTVAVILVFALMTAAFVLLLVVVLPLLADQIRRLFERLPAAFEWVVGTAVPWLQSRLGFEFASFDEQSVLQALQSYWKELSSAAFNVMGTVTRGGQAVVHWLVNLLLIPVVTFYLLRDWDRLVEGVRTLIPRRAEPTISGMCREIDEVLGAFIRGQLMVMLALGLIYTVGLWVVGLDLAFIIGLGAGLLSIVPYLGTFVGVAAALIAAFFQFHDLVHILFVLLVFGAGQSLEGMVLTPLLVGDRIGLHPVVVIFAVLAGGQLFGFLGILLALPVAAALNVVVRQVHDHYMRSGLYERTTGESREA
ncbi:MAG: AI-2E family transporter [Lysobacterales bacterium]|jgi:predicted PurR-regulated permease PerM